jgi:hypothetical protein
VDRGQTVVDGDSWDEKLFQKIIKAAVTPKKSGIM